MPSGILDTAVSGLNSLQRSLQTVSHNIANANTEGYSRQRVELGTNAAQRTGAGFLGKGVHITDIVRQYDEFTSRQLRSSQSTFNDSDQYYVMAEQVDNLMASPDTSVMPAMKQFFNAMNDVANDPASIPARQTLLSEATNLTGRFATMQNRLKELRTQLNQGMSGAVQKINNYAKSIADLNKKISEQSSNANVGYKANDLLDQRDLLISKLSKVVDVSVVPGGNNVLNVFIGQGQPLVLSNGAMAVSVQQSPLDSEKLEIGVKDPSTGAFADITPQLSGGKLSGLIRFRDDLLTPAQQSLGQLAASFSMTMNQQHAAGFDLDGNAGSDLFSGIGAVPVQASAGSTGSISVIFDSSATGLIDSSDYQLSVGTGPSYSLKRLSDNSVISLSNVAGNLVATPPNTLPGIQISIGTAPVAGDEFLIRPTYSAADSIGVALTDPRKIAAASSLNSASGPLPGDNRNALALAGLEQQKIMLNGTASFKGQFTQLVTDVGNKTHSAKVGRSAQEVLLNNAKEQMSTISGVNLDQEAADLIKLQQAYQASAQSIATTKTIFDTLINVVR